MTGAQSRQILIGVATVAALVALAMVVMDMKPGTSSDAPPTREGADATDELRVSSGVGAKAPLHFVLKDLRGVDVKLDSFEGKVVLVNFWATWCGPCRAEIPALISLQQTYPNDIVVLGVVVMDRFGDNVRRFASDLKINYPVLDGTARQDVEDAYGPFGACRRQSLLAAMELSQRNTRGSGQENNSSEK